jgi:alpha-tubulin suppressor-like RCC1 family protein
VAVTEAGAVYSFGMGDGRLGQGKGAEEDVFRPKRIEALDSIHVVTVAAGDLHTLALTRCGRVYSWGGNGLDSPVHGLVCTGLCAAGARSEGQIAGTNRSGSQNRIRKLKKSISAAAQTQAREGAQIPPSHLPHFPLASQAVVENRRLCCSRNKDKERNKK